MESDGITLNKRELRLLKEYMGHHGWNDLLVSHPMPLLVSTFVTVSLLLLPKLVPGFVSPIVGLMAQSE